MLRPRISLASAKLLLARPASKTPSALGRSFFCCSAGHTRLAERPTSGTAPCRQPIFASSHATKRALGTAAQQPGSSGAKIQSVVAGDGALSLEFGGGAEPLHLSTLWLRDSCACPRCVDPDSGQKNLSTADLPDKPTVQSARVAEDGSLEVIWENDVFSAGGSHASSWSAGEIQSWRGDLGVRTPHLLPVERTPWDKATYAALLEDGHCRISYGDWMTNEDAFWAAFAKLCKTGLVFVTGVPEDEAEVVKIANRIGILQYTFYGFTWDVRSKPHAENVAYTSQFLGLHQDLMYHVPIPRLQLLHCLANSCEGGESLFSDGIRAAYELQLDRPELYKTLTHQMVPFHYKKGGHHYEMTRSTILEGEGGLVEATHWAPPFQAPFKRESMVRDPTADGAIVSDPNDPHSLAKWKRAAAAFQSSLEAPENMFQVKLAPGECVVFDNWRLQHGRRQFAAGQGHRWLKGTYVTDQVHRAVENQLQRRRGVTLPDLAEFREEVATSELIKVASSLAARTERRPGSRRLDNEV